IRVGVRKVIALSTDKAVNPINLYGASKLAADKIFVAANHLSGEDGPRFSVVRYGNVGGSRGSVGTFFQKVGREGARSLPLRDPEMTRFWITLHQGVDFVLSSIASMTGGEIFVPKIPSMHLVALARALAPDLPHTIVGIRPGEKVHEALVTEDDARNTAELDDRFVILPNIRFWKNDVFDKFERVASKFTYTSDNNPMRLDAAAFLAMLSESVVEGSSV